MSKARVSKSKQKNRGNAPSNWIETETLNFRVTTTFKKAFKGYAVSQGMTMVELLKEGFELSKRKRKA